MSLLAFLLTHVAFGKRPFSHSKGEKVMRKILIVSIPFAVFAAALVAPAWAARGGGGSGHGATVSAAAHSAHSSGSPVGSSVRGVARSNSQGPSHANANAISHVQNSPGRANSNSVLGNADASASTMTSTQMTSGHGQGKAAKTAKSGKTKGKKSIQ